MCRGPRDKDIVHDARGEHDTTFSASDDSVSRGETSYSLSLSTKLLRLLAGKDGRRRAPNAGKMVVDGQVAKTAAGPRSGQ